MIILSISICLRCQNGGEPASSVKRITPHAQLIDRHVNKSKRELENKNEVNTQDHALQLYGDECWRCNVVNVCNKRKDLQIDFLAIAGVHFIHGTFQYFRSQITRRPTKL